MHPIHHTFGPLADNEQVACALRMTYTPWKYKHGKSTELLRSSIQAFFHEPTFVFASGRQALLASLLAMDLQPGDEVIVQAYTCIVVPNAIIAAGASPIYADIDRDTLNLDVNDIKARLTKKTRAIICQHTFGIPADTKALRTLCDAHDLYLIEDCAHVLPDEHDSTDIGKTGDIVFASFGRDKAISGVAGGAVIVRNTLLQQPIEKLANSATPLSWWTIHTLIHYPLMYRRALPLYSIGIGKLYVRLKRFLKQVVPIVTNDEKRGSMPALVQQMPNACAFLALPQWKKRQHINDHRRKLTTFYLDACGQHGWCDTASPVYVPTGIESTRPLQKFPIFVKNAAALRSALKKKQIYLDDGWTGCVVCPATADGECAGYTEGMDPVAEATAQSILSLPTHPQMTLEQATYLVQELATLIHKK